MITDNTNITYQTLLNISQVQTGATVTNVGTTIKNVAGGSDTNEATRRSLCSAGLYQVGATEATTSVPVTNPIFLAV